MAYRQQISTLRHKRGGGDIYFEVLWTIEDSSTWTQTSGFKQIPVCMSVSLYMASSTVQTNKPILIELGRCCTLSQYLVYSQKLFWKTLKINPCFGKKARVLKQHNTLLTVLIQLLSEIGLGFSTIQYTTQKFTITRFCITTI